MNNDQVFQVMHDMRNALAIIEGSMKDLIHVKGVSSIRENIQLGTDRIIKVVEKIEREEGL